MSRTARSNSLAARRTPRHFALDRQPLWPEKEALPNSHPVSGCWEISRRTLRDLRQRLEAGDFFAPIALVAVSGSLGRMEQTARSDLDLLVVGREDAKDGDLAEAFRQVAALLADAGLPPAGRHSIYARPITATHLWSTEHVGRIDEAPEPFGKRMQLLCDAQPIWDVSDERVIEAGILERYEHAAARVVPGFPAWHLLLLDLQRYYRSLQAKHIQDAEKHPEQVAESYLKLRFSRRLMYCGLLCILAEAVAGGPDWKTTLLAAVRLTPLERIGWRTDAAVPAWRMLADYYGVFLDGLSTERHATDGRLAAAADAFEEGLAEWMSRRAASWPPAVVKALWV